MSTGHPVLLFWQPKSDYLRLLSNSKFGRPILIFLNYVIWVFFFYLSYLLIKADFVNFWRLFFAVIMAEIIERLIKKKIFWRRPMFLRHDQTPPGLVDSWYRSGAFPSGHTVKATFFFLFLIQYPIFSLPLFLIISLSLLFFRVLVGFHYPIDLLGGFIIGFIIWLPCHLINLSTFMDPFLKFIFNTIFLIN
jgi:membrane-associated phospholipid phosphatase